MRTTLALRRRPERVSRRILPMLAVLALALASTRTDAQVQGANMPVGSGARPAAEALAPGDVVRVRIGGEPGLSGDFAVDESGMVALPRLGRVAATGEPAAALRDRIVRGYAPFVDPAAIEVTLLRRVEVLGAVRTPGRYPVGAAMTVDEVLVLAGGPTPRAHSNRVALVHSDGTGSVVSRRTRIGELPLRGGDQLFIPERASLTGNTYVLLGTLTAILCLATTLSH